MMVYLDMDPGHDDALALLVALKTFPVAAVTTVAGNQTVDKTFLNARRILHLAGRPEIPVYRGADAPLFYPLVVADTVHGDSGLDGYTFPPLPEADTAGISAISWLGRTLTEAEEPIDWIATGPLTNVARVLLGHPEARRAIRSLTVMGGSLGTGNITPEAEFNFYVDPDAAQWVLAAGLPLTMVGLDVTRKARLTREDVGRFIGWGTPVGDALYHLLTFYGRHEPQASDVGMPIHDVLAVAALAIPEVFRWEWLSLRVFREDSPLRGASRPASDGKGPVVRVAVDIDTPRFFEWFWAQLQDYRTIG